MIFNVMLPKSDRGMALFQERFDDLTNTSGENAIAHEVEDFRERLIYHARETARLDNSDSIRADHVVMAAMDLLDMDLSEADDTDHFHRLVHNWNIAPVSARKHFTGWLNSKASSDDN